VICLSKKAPGKSLGASLGNRRRERSSLRLIIAKIDNLDPTGPLWLLTLWLLVSVAESPAAFVVVTARSVLPRLAYLSATTHDNAAETNLRAFRDGLKTPTVSPGSRDTGRCIRYPSWPPFTASQKPIERSRVDPAKSREPDRPACA
jgi:hypothetical protein